MQQIKYDPMCVIDIYSHFFTVKRCTPRISGIIYRFSWKYTQYEFVSNGQRTERVPGRTYGLKTRDNSEFRFHIGQLKELIQMFEREFIEPQMYEWHVHELYTPVSISVEANEEYTLYPQQENAREFILAPDEEGDLRTRFIAMPTGGGKTVVTNVSLADPRSRTRTMVALLPKYMKKWPGDICSITNTSPKKVMVIQGTDQIKGLVELAKEGGPLPNYFVVSLPSLLIWYKAYEEDPEGTLEQYGCQPWELAQLLGLGTIVVDEAHENLHGVYRLMIFSHVPKFVGLSGTLLARDAFVDRMQHMMFPREMRFEEIKMKKYIKAYAMSYSFKDFQKAAIRTTERGRTTYSQTAYEKSILKRKDTTSGYLNLVDYLFRHFYLDDYKEGDRMAIFAGSVKMCTAIVEYLSKKYPKLSVKRFTEGDPYTNMTEADVRVTTVTSGGTAHDVKNLRVSLMTNSIQEHRANLQVLGRLRELKDRDVKFAYMYCDQIQKHVNYHREKQELFQDRVASMKDFHCPVQV
jgi:superfamily II DNA or RNA helicase